mgnify:CR=1 FL=1
MRFLKMLNQNFHLGIRYNAQKLNDIEMLKTMSIHMIFHTLGQDNKEQNDAAIQHGENI